MDDKEIARKFASNGGKKRSLRLSKEQKVASARNAAILRWYPSVQVYEVIKNNPLQKAKYLAEMKKLRQKNKLP